MIERRFQVATLAVYVIATAVILTISWFQCDGHFFYALDDPYIHLSIAENIARGHYGINLEEYSSPSSSIIYPFLLAPFAWLGIERMVPLLIGVASMAAILWLVSGFFARHVIAGGTREHSLGWLLLAPFLVLAINGVALPIAGMEHPLHVLTVVLTILGLVNLGETGRMPPVLLIGIFLAPLFRFEGLALSSAAIVVLVLKGRKRAAIGLTAAIGLSLLSYGVFMHLHGLPLLPSSVMVKSTVSAAAADQGPLRVVAGIAQNLVGSFKNRWGTLLLVGIVLLLPALGTIRARHRDGRMALDLDTRAMVALAVIGAVAAHLVLGAYGWFGRYEVYILTALLLAVIYVLSHAIRRIEPGWLRIATCALALTLLDFSYVKTTWDTPGAARNVYEQQYQLHRFVTDFFRHPVAVNDIGYVSYRNDGFVLDLYGLGSEEARKLLKSGNRDLDSFAAMVQRHHVPLAMIYQNWFQGAAPSGWVPIAQLTTDKVTSGDSTVTFYLTDPSRREELMHALRRFAPTLPRRVKFVVGTESIPQAPVQSCPIEHVLP
ncbi:hypothetical protein GGR39_001049 [Novosphingobium fluoreni]|uniref:Glycosyltransferase RgtA/B/C/D-like domain-containing protein n=1 Tax=Novosphingobium fluoreni TaxID=1391222 RepID=A0A7W6BWT3_9SPHN|nr:hypothetical protein [Novosphingobium fluoreni]MBB3939409.1 hypothetical protein [Novosphingobium fluoreni]